MQSTQLEVAVPTRGLDSGLARAVHNHFIDLWESAEELTEELLRTAGSKDVSNTPAVDALPHAIVQGTEEYKDQPIQMREFVRKQVSKLPELQAVMPAPNPLDLGGRQILWVDDHPTNNALEVQTLKQLGADIIQVTSTDEANTLLRKSHQMLRTADRSKFDLIISDLNREERGDTNPNAGFELFDHIQRDSNLKSYRDVPFIFYSDSVGRVDELPDKRVYGTTGEANELIDLVISALQDLEQNREAL